jgi:hypothetical protein
MATEKLRLVLKRLKANSAPAAAAYFVSRVSKVRV